MLEDADYEAAYDLPDLEAKEPTEVVLSLVDVKLKGVSGVEAVVQEFTNRHANLPVTIRIQSQD